MCIVQLCSSSMKTENNNNKSFIIHVIVYNLLCNPSSLAGLDYRKIYFIHDALTIQTWYTCKYILTAQNELLTKREWLKNVMTKSQTASTDEQSCLQIHSKVQIFLFTSLWRSISITAYTKPTHTYYVLIYTIDPQRKDLISDRLTHKFTWSVLKHTTIFFILDFYWFSPIE